MPSTKPTMSRGEVSRRWRQAQGDYIREWRLAKGMTQSDLVAALGTSAHQLASHIETGRINLPIERIEDFAAILDVPLAEFAKVLLRFHNPGSILHYLEPTQNFKKNLGRLQADSM